MCRSTVRRAVGRKLLKEIEFLTLITEIEAILNTWLLTYINFDDCQIIRPVDFISPNTPFSLPNYDLDKNEFIPHQPNTREELMEYWSNTLKSLDKFWEVWRNEYLVSLRERTQIQHKSPRTVEEKIPPKGEIVLINIPELPRSFWKPAKIKELMRGKDSQIRNVLIEMPNKQIFF